MATNTPLSLFYSLFLSISGTFGPPLKFMGLSFILQNESEGDIQKGPMFLQLSDKFVPLIPHSC